MNQNRIDLSANWAVKGADTILEREPLMNLKGKWEYEDGLLLNGIYAVYDLTKNKKYLRYIKNNLDEFVDDQGTIKGYHYSEFTLDNINGGKALLDIYQETNQKKYKLAADHLFDQLLHQPRTQDGTFWHKKIYPYQIWLDGLYMADVFYARYQQEFGIDKYYRDVIKQFLNAYQDTLDKQSGLCFHVYDEKKSQTWSDEKGHSPHFWTRSIGWFLMSMTDVLEYLPETFEEKDKIKTNLTELLSAVQNVADKKTNLWYQVTDQGDRPLNYLEASGSLMILNAIAKSIRKGYINKKDWLPILEKGWQQALDNFITVTKEDWVNVNKIVEVGGLGGDKKRDGSYAYYMSEPIVANDHKGFGPFLLLAAEMEKIG
ncbi:glycoside hydrolase family 88/105 protein [Liquorilactobacillus nagelii]|uniref:glycoside hydrolase family 88/105 protein n=1 Tax=Liquorilactobacillus nagelii TaxID=82688 RepID=UPI0039E9465A